MNFLGNYLFPTAVNLFRLSTAQPLCSSDWLKGTFLVTPVSPHRGTPLLCRVGVATIIKVSPRYTPQTPPEQLEKGTTRSALGCQCYDWPALNLNEVSRNRKRDGEYY